MQQTNLKPWTRGGIQAAEVKMSENLSDIVKKTLPDLVSEVYNEVLQENFNAWICNRNRYYEHDKK